MDNTVQKGPKIGEKISLLPSLLSADFSKLGVYAKKALDAGAHDYVTKPVNRRIVSARVRSALRIKQARDETDSCEAEIISARPGPAKVQGRNRIVKARGRDSTR